MTDALEKSQAAAPKHNRGRRRLNNVSMMIHVNRSWVTMLEEAAARRGLHRAELLRAIIGERLAAEAVELERARAGVSTRELEAETKAAASTQA